MNQVPPPGRKLLHPSRYLLDSIVRFLLDATLRARHGDVPPSGHLVPPDFAGICVATSPAPASDRYVIERLRELGISRVRLDYSYDSPGRHGARLLAALLDEGFAVLLHLVQPLEEAEGMMEVDSQQRWRAFVADALDAFGDRVELIEVGSTINRRRWAGYSLEGFVACWHTAFVEARQRGLRISGPNISDYEPLYAISVLNLLRERGELPEYYTNNLFVERVIQPEVYDHRIFGALLAPWFRYNLVRKARQMRQIAAAAGVDGMFCAYVSWTLPRIRRFLPDATGKQADYLVRYLVLAAASGAFRRVYWGALINRREGVIDDPGAESPDEEIVTYYRRLSAHPDRYRLRPAFHALRAFQALVPGAIYEGALGRSQGLEIHAFASAQRRVHVLWCMNGQIAELASLYAPAQLQQARCIDRDGAPLPEPPSLVTESPLYLCWEAAEVARVSADPRLLQGIAISIATPGHYHFHRDDPAAGGGWRGIVRARDRAEAELLIEALHPDRIGNLPVERTLRRSRNAIWTVRDPRDPARELVVKQPARVSWNKRLVEPFKPSKALRSWNGACELLRRGVATPLPVAFFERADGTDLLRNWYLCELAPTTLSVRHFFMAYAQGETSVHGITLERFLDALCLFVLDMHRRGVFFRDLSGGNVLVTLGAAPDAAAAVGMDSSDPVGIRAHAELDAVTFSFSLIDTARAHFYSSPLSLRRRMADLVRLLHKLHDAGRDRFLEQYLAGTGRRFRAVHRLPLRGFDLQAGWKRSRRAQR